MNDNKWNLHTISGFWSEWLVNFHFKIKKMR